MGYGDRRRTDAGAGGGFPQRRPRRPAAPATRPGRQEGCAIKKGQFTRNAQEALKKAREAALDYEARNIMGGGIGNLQDIYDALSGGRFRDNRTVIYGHGSSYYRSVESRVHETIANYAALSITRPDLIDLLRADKPDLVAELDAAIQELLKKAGG